MAATPLAERSIPLKIFGVAFLAMLVFFVWLTYAFFNKTFVDSDFVTLETGKSGQSLPKNADVKLRGMIVGSVREIEPAGDGVTMQLAMDPDLIDRVPSGVTARIVPKTLFGEKFIDLLPPEGTGPDSEPLAAGDTITRADVPIEVEELLNDLYPLLQAVEPADLSYTLTAVSQALDGNGEKLGDTLVTLNSYLKELNPEVPVLVDDVVKLGEVSDIYARELPTLARLLRNSVTTGNTVVAKRTELAAFFDEGTRLSNTLSTFLETNVDDIEALNSQSRTILGVSAKYSSTFPCFLGGMAASIPRLDSVLGNRTVHIDLKTLEEQPTPYSDDENASIPSQAAIDATPEAQPTGGPNTLEGPCGRLPRYSSDNKDANNPFGAADFNENGPYPGPDARVYKLVGLQDSHNNKFGTDADFQRAAAASLAEAGYWEPSLMDVDSDEQRQQVRRLAARMAGVEADEVPGAASLLLSPVLRGAEVELP